MAYLDENGLLYVWQKIKAHVTSVVPTKTSDLTNDSGFITSSDIPSGVSPSSTTPKMDGTAAVGTETNFARGDHIHPSDTSKVDKVTGKGLSENDFTTTLKNKLDGIAAGAEVNVNADWNASSGDAQILNKPTLPSKIATGNARIFYGTCSTSASTAEKSVTCSDYDALTTGDIVAVTFSNINSAANPTLKVNGKTAKAIKVMTNGSLSSPVPVDLVGGACVFVYNGTYWVLQSANSNTQYNAGTQALIEAGSNTEERVWQAKILHDYIAATIETAQTGAAMYKGTVNAGTDISGLTSFKQGWYWVVATAGTYCGESCEVGDMIFCNTTGTSYSASYFDIVQTNIVAITNGSIDTICV